MPQSTFGTLAASRRQRFTRAFCAKAQIPRNPKRKVNFPRHACGWVTPGDARDGSQCAWPSSSRAYKFSAHSPTREDNLPWLFASERQAQLTRQAVNYIVRVVGEKANLHAGPLLRLLPRRQGHRITNDAGLPRASRSQAHQPLYQGCRGTVEVKVASKSSTCRSTVSFTTDSSSTLTLHSRSYQHGDNERDDHEDGSDRA